MLKALLILSNLLIINLSFAQSLKLNSQVIQDFCYSFRFKHKVERNEGARTVAFLAGRNLGYSYVDIEVGIEQLEKNKGFQEEIFRNLYFLCKCGKEDMGMQLIAFGMRASEAKLLAAYIIEKYAREIDQETAEIKRKNKEEESRRIEVVDVDAEFIGGHEALMAYISKNLQYPDSARKNGIGGRVVIQFTIEKDGTIANVKVAEGEEIGYGLPEEAIRVVKEMPSWRPASIRGKSLRSYRKLPMNFSVNNVDEKEKKKPVKAVMPKRTERKE